MRDGSIHITVSGSGELAGDETITTKAFGKLYTKNSSRYVLYEVPEEDNPGIVMKHMLKIYGSTLEMTKSTPADIHNKSHIIYKTGTKSETDYATPYGVLKLTFDTRYLTVNESADRLEISLRYNILMNEDVLSRNRLEILIITAD